MEKHKLGKSGLEVSDPGLGCMGMSFSFPPFPNRQEMVSLIRTAVERGGKEEDIRKEIDKLGYVEILSFRHSESDKLLTIGKGK